MHESLDTSVYSKIPRAEEYMLSGNRFSYSSLGNPYDSEAINKIPEKPVIIRKITKYFMIRLPREYDCHKVFASFILLRIKSEI